MALQTHGAVWPGTAPAVIASSAWALLVWSLSRLGLFPNFGAGSASLSGVLSMIVGLLVSYRCARRFISRLSVQLLVLERSLARRSPALELDDIYSTHARPHTRAQPAAARSGWSSSLRRGRPIDVPAHRRVPGRAQVRSQEC